MRVLLCGAVLLVNFLASGSALAQTSPDETPPPDAPAAPAEPPAQTEAVSEAPSAIENAPAGDIEDVPLEELLVITASRSSEPLREAPSPITVITSEMIRASASRNLIDVLTAYVPGMTYAADANEANVAMRGIYGSAQQKILIMVDGHRLNQRAYLSAPPDYGISISPEKVARIEVLRGPGSSIYGNVALTAVINIVTKAGKDLDGAHAVLSGGNFGQARLDLAYGKEFAPNHDLALWGTVYRANGEIRHIPIEDDYSATPRGGDTHVDRVKQPENYDIGMRYRVRDWGFYAQQTRNSTSSQFSDLGLMGEIYDYGSLRSFEGIKTGVVNSTTHLALDYNHTIGQAFTVTGQLGFDAGTIRVGGVSSSTDNRSILAWNERGLNGFVQGKYDYDISGLGGGSAMLGVVADVWQLVDSINITGTNGQLETVPDVRGNELLRTGHEGIYSGYAQVKQHLGKMFLLNVGARYDYKQRRGPLGPPFPLPKVDNVSDLSPRVALIFAPVDEFDVKLSYSESFVDAPYWYRYNNIPSYQGAVDLKPEKLRSAQLTPTVRLLDNKLISTTNFSYNKLVDGVYRVPNANIDPTNPVYYQNAGNLETATIEEELQFNSEYATVRAQGTMYYVLDVDHYQAFDDASKAIDPARDFKHRIWNVPMFYGAIVGSTRPLKPWAPATWLDLIVRYSGKQQSPISGVSINRPDANANLLNQIPSRVIFDLGLRSADLYVPGLTLAANVHNLFDHRYAQGGTTRFPYPQEGRWFLVQLGYAFSP